MTNKTVLRVVMGLILVVIIAIAAQKYANRHSFELPAQPVSGHVAPTADNAAPASTKAK